MSLLVDRAKRDTPQSCQSRQCRGAGCFLSLKGISDQRILIDMDCEELDVPPDRKRCDYVFVGAEVWIVPIELKRGSVDAARVKEQLQTGASFAQEKLATKGAKIRFRPLAAYGGKVHRSQTEALKKPQTRVRFGNKTYEIKLIRCGDTLAGALS